MMTKPSFPEIEGKGEKTKIHGSYIFREAFLPGAGDTRIITPAGYPEKYNIGKGTRIQRYDSFLSFVNGHKWS